MQVPNFVIFGAIEALVLLLVLFVGLLLYLRSLKRKLQKTKDQVLQMLEKNQTLLSTLEQERIEHTATNSYKQQINDQLLITREYHGTLGANQDIALDLDPEVPINRQAAAIRHAILIAEKEALNASPDGKPNWSFLESKFQQIIGFYVDLDQGKIPDKDEVDWKVQFGKAKESLENAMLDFAEARKEVEALENDLETAHKRIANLEKFKQLFFEMEDQWKAAKDEAQLYYDRIMASRAAGDDEATFTTVLDEYHNVYHEVEKTIYSQTRDRDENASPAVLSSNESLQEVAQQLTTESIADNDARALEELKKLRNLTADQHRLISQLQEKLRAAETLEEKQAIIDELEQELEKHIRFAEESEMCIQLLETELAAAMEKTKSLNDVLDDTKKELEHLPMMEGIIRQFTLESKEMLRGLAEMERSKDSSSEADESDEQLEKLQTQLQHLQAQYAELEERYLEARTAQ